MNAIMFLITPDPNSSTEYVVGAIIALFILGYLLYALVNPEKF